MQSPGSKRGLTKARVCEPLVFVRRLCIRKYISLSPRKRRSSCHFLTGLRGHESLVTKLASSWSNNLNSQSVSSSSAGSRPAMRATTRDLTLYETRYLHCRCRRTSRKPRSRRSELDKGDSHAFLFETIVRHTYPEQCITFTKKKTVNLWDDSRQEQTVSTRVAPARWRLHCVKSNARHGHFGHVFCFLHAYTTSDLRKFRRTCGHVRKECSLEISVDITNRKGRERKKKQKKK